MIAKEFSSRGELSVQRFKIKKAPSISCILGLILGCAFSPGGFRDDPVPKSLLWPLISFGFFFILIVVGAWLEKMWLPARAPDVMLARFVELLGWFMNGVGLGFGLSSLWTDDSQIWSGSLFFASGLGILSGMKLARVILRIQYKQK